MKTTSGKSNWGIAVLRITVGVIFVAHGAQKLFTFGIPGLSEFMSQQGIPFPMISAIAVTGAELLGGVALVAGLFTRWAAVPLAFSMLVALLAVHLKGGFFLPTGIEYSLALLAASISLSLTGSGAFSVDGLVERRREFIAVETPAPQTASSVGV